MVDNKIKTIFAQICIFSEGNINKAYSLINMLYEHYLKFESETQNMLGDKIHEFINIDEIEKKRIETLTNREEIVKSKLEYINKGDSKFIEKIIPELNFINRLLDKPTAHQLLKENEQEKSEVEKAFKKDEAIKILKKPFFDKIDWILIFILIVLSIIIASEIIILGVISK